MQLQDRFQRSLISHGCLLILWLSALGCYQSFSLPTLPTLPTPFFLLHLVLSSSSYFSSLVGTVLNWKTLPRPLAGAGLQESRPPQRCRKDRASGQTGAGERAEFGVWLQGWAEQVSLAYELPYRAQLSHARVRITISCWHLL